MYGFEQGIEQNKELQVDNNRIDSAISSKEATKMLAGGEWRAPSHHLPDVW